jgi:hypothetical protein
MNLAILLSTCDAYAPVARFTHARLDTCWADHPPVWFCGLTAAADDVLPFTGDARDWIGITHQAVAALAARGVEWLYLILDDHPPFGPCQADFLNRVLPANAAALGAIQVNLLGWDQFQPQSGTVLGREHLWWQRNAEDFRWKFSLHPGFWHAPTLRDILAQLRALQPTTLSARAFESGADAAARALDPALCGRTFRICGDAFSAGRRWHERRRTRAAAKLALHVARLLARLGGARTLQKLDDRLQPYFRFVNGPYPMFWSGLISRGQLHAAALDFLERTGATDVARSIRNLPPVR